MFKICWIKDFYDVVYDYYYDLSEDKVYCVNLAEYNKTQIQVTPIIALCGPFTSICGSIFSGQLFLSINGCILFLTIATILTALPISLFYNKTYKTQIKYIKEHSIGEHMNVAEIKALLQEGRKYTYGLMLFILACLMGAWFGANTLIYNHDQIGLIIFVAAILALTICIKMLSPINFLRLLIRLKKQK